MLSLAQGHGIERRWGGNFSDKMVREGQDGENHRKALLLSSFKDEKSKVQDVKCVSRGLTLGKKSGSAAGSV